MNIFHGTSLNNLKNIEAQGKLLPRKFTNKNNWGEDYQQPSIANSIYFTSNLLFAEFYAIRTSFIDKDQKYVIIETNISNLNTRQLRPDENLFSDQSKTFLNKHDMLLMQKRAKKSKSWRKSLQKTQLIRYCKEININKTKSSIYNIEDNRFWFLIKDTKDVLELTIKFNILFAFSIKYKTNNFDGLQFIKNNNKIYLINDN